MKTGLSEVRGQRSEVAGRRFTSAEVLTLVRRRARRIQRLLQAGAASRPTLYPARHA